MKVRSRMLSLSVTRGIAALCAAACVARAPSPARAAGVVGTGSAASCTDAALNTALAGGGVVTFDCGAGPATIDISAGSGTKTIAADTIVDGGGLVTISGGHTVRVFHVLDAVNFTVENVTIADGYAFPTDDSAPVGGGIFNGTGVLTVTNSTFAGNTAHNGGAIFTNGVLGGSVTVTNCTFTNNSAIESGGGIQNDNPTLTVTNSTFTGNSADNGGAIANTPTCTGCGMLIIINSTFTGNDASDTVFGAVVASHYIEGPLAPALLRNTIVANSRTGENCFADITDGGHNLDDGTSCGFSEANGSLSSTAPQFDPAGLRDNGGPTQTVALCTAVGMPAGCTAASPAIDAGDQAVCAAAPVNNLDQRGLVRPGSGHTQCSIGAYEADAIPPEACTGDCDENGRVAVNELVIGVNIALLVKPLNACPAFADSQGMVLIAQLIRGVNNALEGCRG